MTVSRIFPRLYIKLVQTLLKVKRSGGCAVSGRIFLFQSVFSPKTFSLSRLYNGRWLLRKQTTDGKESSKINNNLNRLRCTIQMSIKIKGCYLYKTNGNGGKRQTAPRPEKIILPCGTFSIALPLCFTFISPTSTFVVLRSLVPGFFCRRPLFAYCSRSRYFRLTDLMNARMSDWLDGHVVEWLIGLLNCWSYATIHPISIAFGYT